MFLINTPFDRQLIDVTYILTIIRGNAFIFREVVKLLLQYEASTNVVDAKGSSPLHLAAWAGDAEIVRLILTQGPSVPKVNLTVSKFILLLFLLIFFI